MAGASVVLVEAHPNPLIAKSDGFQGLFPEQLPRAGARGARAWRLRRELDRSYLASAAVEKGYWRAWRRTGRGCSGQGTLLQGAELTESRCGNVLDQADTPPTSWVS